MKKHFWRFRRPAGCLVCVLLLLALAWFLRLVYGVPPLGAEAELRRVERRYHRPAGELVQIIEEGDLFGAAVTRHEGELYTYMLFPADGSTLKGPRRYDGGGPWRDTVRDFSWGCTTPGMSYFVYQNNTNELQKRFYVLVKQSDPNVVSGKLEIVSTMEEGSRTWRSSAERLYPDYLAFPMEITRGSETSRLMYQSILNGHSYNAEKPVTAEAEAVFYDAEGNEVSRIAFDMIRDSADQERSEDNGA